MLKRDAPPPYLSCKLLSAIAGFLPITKDETPPELCIWMSALAVNVPIPKLVAVATPILEDA